MSALFCNSAVDFQTFHPRFDWRNLSVLPNNQPQLTCLKFLMKMFSRGEDGRLIKFRTIESGEFVSNVYLDKPSGVLSN